MIMGKSEAGLVAVGDVLQVMPNRLRVKVEAVYRDEQESFAAKVRPLAWRSRCRTLGSACGMMQPIRRLLPAHAHVAASGCPLVAPSLPARRARTSGCA